MASMVVLASSTLIIRKRLRRDQDSPRLSVSPLETGVSRAYSDELKTTTWLEQDLVGTTESATPHNL
jgi:hypothetical protein